MNMPSFFPSDFDPQAEIVLMAGRGDYPRLMWQQLQAVCPRAKIFAFAADEAPWLQSVPSDRVLVFNIGQVGHWLKALKQNGTRYAISAGQIQPKKLFHGLNPDLKAITLLARLKEKNASTIFGVLLREIEALGITTLDARCFMESHLATPGMMTQRAHTAVDPQVLQHGITVCRGIAALNIGQSVIVSNGTTIIVEAFDGTDAMIQRAGQICNREMGLIKLAKDTQDFRFDVPVFGLQTVQNLHTSHIQWAALESHRTILLNQSQVIDEADRLGITLMGF